MFTNNNGPMIHELSDVINNWVKHIDYSEILQAPPNTITFNLGPEHSEMLRIAEDGFWVRGVKVEQTDKEAATVYNVFRQWLTWAQLNRD